MSHFEPQGLGWQPSAPDFRDYSPNSPEVAALVERLRAGGGGRSAAAASVDLREYFVDVYDQRTLNTSTAHATAGLVEYFERRAHGHLLRPSRLFLHQNALKLAGLSGNCGVDLRTTLKAMVRFGLPPEQLWPYDASAMSKQPAPFLYSFTDPYRAAVYVRLDGHRTSPEQCLQNVKAFLSAGFACAFGFSVPNSLTDDGEITYRPTFDSLYGGQALIAVGYDDRWLRSSRGALLVRSSWGVQWGQKGYGWLPYAFVEEQLAIDFWTLLHPAWMDSGEFDVPQIAS
jgi:C1A family cysteine protease